MSFVDPRIAQKVAHLPEIHAAVLAERDKVAHIAVGLFASHDNPGGHEINTHDHGDGFDDIDGVVNLDGPAPLAVEFGHFAGTEDGGDDRTFVSGLHILGRTAAIASA